MTCYVLTGTCPRTRAELRDDLAREAEALGQPVKAEYMRMLARRVRRDGDSPQAGWQFRGPMFICEGGAREDPTAVCPCGHLSEYLCDEPIGNGATCDRPMCRCCRTAVGDDLDRCQFHVAVSA